MSTEKELSGQSRSEKHVKSGKQKKGQGKKGCLIALIVLIAIFLLAASAIFMAMMNIKPPAIEHIINGETAEKEERSDGIYSVLVVGTDKVGLNTDTILVASLDSINNRASVMSIPRDTMSNVNRSVKKINAAYASGAKNGKGNINQLKKEVANLIGFEVDNYVVVNLSAFEQLIDAIGGVTIDVPRNMNYDDPYQNLHIHINKGLQTLNGEQAIGFVRYRSGYAEGDLGRVKAQQMFIKAVVDKLATPATVTKMPKLIDIVLDNMDTDLTNGQLIWFGKEVLEIDMETNFNMFVLPGEPQYVNKLSYYLPDEAAILEIVNAYFNPNETAITKLNVVDVASIRQKEAARQAALTAEQRRQEETLQQELEQQAATGGDAPQDGEVQQPEGAGTETPSDNTAQQEPISSPESGEAGQEGQQVIQSGNIPGEVLSGQDVPANSTDQQQGEAVQGTPSQQVQEEQTTVQPGAIPGEVLKQDTAQ